MSRRVLTLALTIAMAVLLAASGLAGAGKASAATTHQTFLTFYGWYDNTPPGGEIAYPKLHDTAGGKGTYADPITFATTTAVYKPGTKVWVPRVKKYFIMEDSCQECGADWSGEGPNGGPGLRHIDLWIGGKGGSAMDAIDCEDALTNYHPDGKPVMEPVVVDPSPNEQYDPTPIFNTGTGECYGGAQPKTTIGQYRNGSNAQCLENPNNGTTAGVQLKTAACNGSPAQRFTFHGAWLISNDLCAAMSSGKVVLQKCTGGPAQQWSVNPNGTISDIQTGGKCVRASGTSVVAGSCSGSASQWVFTSAAPGELAIGVNPVSGSVAPGGSATATVNVSGGDQQVALSSSGVPAGVTASFEPATVTPGSTSKATFAVAADTPSGTYAVMVTGTSSAATRSATYSLTVTGPGSGRPVLLSQGKTANASSAESATYAASKAFDGNLTGTRWASKEGADPQWLSVDLGATSAISRVTLNWEAAYGKSYAIQTSPDGTTWTTIYSTTSGNGGADELTGLAGSGRFVRINGTARGTAYGYSLFEMQVYGTVSP